jgi:type IV pilus assembly protein PilA
LSGFHSWISGTRAGNFAGAWVRQDFLIVQKFPIRVARTCLKDRRDSQVVRRRIFGLSVLVMLAVLMPVPTGREVFRATETAAIRDMEIISSMQTQYFSQFGKYASTLMELGPPASGVTSGPSGANLIPTSLASGRKNGYVFTVAGVPAGYTVRATPILFGKTGRRTFYVDQRMIIHQNWGPEPASAESPEFQ